MIPDLVTSSEKKINFPARTIRPIAAASLQGIAFKGDFLITVDSINGYLLQVDPANNNTTVLNYQNNQDFVDARGLAVADDTIWFTREEGVYFCSAQENFVPQLFVSLPYTVDGVAVVGTTVYVTSHKSGYIFIFSRESGREITRLYAPGIGTENIAVRGEELWVSDETEQTVYCLDRATGEVLFSVLTPFDCPTGLAFYQDETGQETLYVSYFHDEPYIRDNPNAYPNYQLEFRDRTFVHPLYFNYNRQAGYALSNGYLVEMCYIEELSALEEVSLDDVE